MINVKPVPSAATIVAASNATELGTRKRKHADRFSSYTEFRAKKPRKVSSDKAEATTKAPEDVLVGTRVSVKYKHRSSGTVTHSLTYYNGKYLRVKFDDRTVDDLTRDEVEKFAEDFKLFLKRELSDTSSLLSDSSFLLMSSDDEEVGRAESDQGDKETDCHTDNPLLDKTIDCKEASEGFDDNDESSEYSWGEELEIV